MKMKTLVTGIWIFVCRKNDEKWNKRWLFDFISLIKGITFFLQQVFCRRRSRYLICLNFRKWDRATYNFSFQKHSSWILLFHLSKWISYIINLINDEVWRNLYSGLIIRRLINIFRFQIQGLGLLPLARLHVYSELLEGNFASRVFECDNVSKMTQMHEY